jgi:hypothetical protein
MRTLLLLLILISTAGCATPRLYPMTVYVCSEAEVAAGTCPADVEGKDCEWYTDAAGTRVLSCKGLCELRERE